MEQQVNESKPNVPAVNTAGAGAAHAAAEEAKEKAQGAAALSPPTPQITPAQMEERIREAEENANMRVVQDPANNRLYIQELDEDGNVVYQETYFFFNGEFRLKQIDREGYDPIKFRYNRRGLARVSGGARQDAESVDELLEREKAGRLTLGDRENLANLRAEATELLGSLAEKAGTGLLNLGAAYLDSKLPGAGGLLQSSAATGLIGWFKRKIQVVDGNGRVTTKEELQQLQELEEQIKALRERDFDDVEPDEDLLRRAIESDIPGAYVTALLFSNDEKTRAIAWNALKFDATIRIVTLGVGGGAKIIVRRAGKVDEAIDLGAKSVDDVRERLKRVRKLLGHNEYVVENAAKVRKTKAALLAFYKKNAKMPKIDFAPIYGAQIDTVTGTIKISEEIRDNYPHLLDGYILEELHHFHQLFTRGWLGRRLTAAEEKLLEDEVARRLLKSGLKIFDPR